MPENLGELIAIILAAVVIIYFLMKAISEK